MTNREAIETIKANYPPENYTALREALDKAINLLETVYLEEPLPPNKRIKIAFEETSKLPIMGYYSIN